jgi:hypothetical protein
MFVPDRVKASLRCFAAPACDGRRHTSDAGTLCARTVAASIAAMATGKARPAFFGHIGLDYSRKAAPSFVPHQAIVRTRNGSFI